MIVHARLSAIKGIKPHEWIIRFVFGGAVCVIAGLISQKFGPGYRWPLPRLSRHLSRRSEPR